MPTKDIYRHYLGNEACSYGCAKPGSDHFIFDEESDYGYPTYYWFTRENVAPFES